MGDIQYQSYDTAQADYNTWGALLESVAVSYPDVRFGVLGGDMVQQGQAPTCWQMFYRQATKVFSSLPMLAVPGNHESNASNGKPAMYLDMFSLPSNGPAGLEEEFYSYDYGNCHFVCLSSNVLAGEQVALGGMQAPDYDAIKNWIASDLGSSDATWKIVVLHHPPYAVVDDSVAAAVLSEWEPLLVSAQVDLVLCGHQHVYMRTKAIRGITEVMGNSGSKFYAPASVGYSRCMIPYVSTCEVISVTPTELTLNAVDSAGNILDTVTLQPKDRSVTPVWSD
jgi:3',5'-cyclic AMP phosphodiesterase CpdA